MRTINNRLETLDSSRYGRVWIYFFLLLFYAMVHAPRVFILNNFGPAIFPLNAIYIANNLLLQGGSINHGLAHTLISPSNLTLDYPPGIYLMSLIAGNVRNAFIILFAVQLLLPILLYKLYRTVSSPLTAIAVSIPSIFYFMDSNWWSPDFFIEPLIIIGLTIILRLRPSSVSFKGMMHLGLLSGVIIFFKHNEGIFWIAVCISAVSILSMEHSGDGRQGPVRGRWFLFSLIAVWFFFGLLFMARQLHLDAVIYYTLPYVAFWGLILRHTSRTKNIGFDLSGFLINLIVLLLFTSIVPVLFFLWMGGAVGYARYFSSFGMGLDYQHLWDHGIVWIIKHYIRFEGLANPKSVYANYLSAVQPPMFLIPFVASLFGIYRLSRTMKRLGIEDIKRDAVVVCAAVMGALMFFPLEGIHILESKLFIYFFLLLYFIKQSLFEFSRPIKAILVLLFLLPVLLFGTIKPVLALRATTSYGTPQVQSAMNISMEKWIANELDKQVETVKRSTNGASYYVIDSGGAALMTLLNFVDNHYPQYYLEMRKGIMNNEVKESIISSLREVPYAVVSLHDYQKYLDGRQDDPFMAQILKFVNDNYTEVDRYETTNPSSQILGFVVMKKR